MARLGRIISWRTAIFIATIVLLFGIVVSRTLMKQEASASLPQTIEEYRSVLRQPGFGMYFLDFPAALPRPAGVSSMDDAKLLGHRRE